MGIAERDAVSYGTVDLPRAEPPAWLLVLISAGVFSGCSCWFATNAVLKDIAANFGSEVEVLVFTTAAIQLGFILGTLISAVTSIADLLRPKQVFAASCALTAATNAAVLAADSISLLVASRLFTGICLAGVYPVGMKIVSSWYPADRLGGAIGCVVGALVLGTAFPPALAAGGGALPWRLVIASVSLLSLAGGVAVGLGGDVGPLHKAAPRYDPSAVRAIFEDRLFRANMFGYVGHNWELYAFWAFVPKFAEIWQGHAGAWWYGSESAATLSGAEAHLLAFMAIGVGALSCVTSMQLTCGSVRLAFYYLLASGLCCVVSPVVIMFAPLSVLVAFLLFWGWVVVGDSPHFSAISARLAPPHLTASAITSVVCIGFVFTVLSVAAIGAALAVVDPRFVFLVVLAPGPILGLLGFRPVLAEPEL